MAVQVTIPEIGESINEGILAEWSVADGAYVEAEQPVLVLETDKITMNVNAAASGTLSIQVAEGETVQVGQVVAIIDDTAIAPSAGDAATPEPAGDDAVEAATGAPRTDALPPAVRRLLAEHEIDPATVRPSGRDGRLTKEDVLQHVEQATNPPVVQAREAVKESPPAAPEPSPAPTPVTTARQTRTTMTPLRQRIAQRLVEVQQNAAILTTFNEADMNRVIELRGRYKEPFKKRHDIGLGFMSFFVKAAVEALKTVPQVNAFIEGDEMVTNHYYDIGVAVSTDKGLVVPVIRNADQLTVAGVERVIMDLAVRARDRKLELSDLTGATFTISNGGIFGSMMSTPILNPPGSAILGMHAIQKRAVVVDDEIVIRPMMYLALSYDHRLVDGREAVTFLNRIKECIENPERIMLEV